MTSGICEARDGSVAYALSDFGMSGFYGIRNGKDYQRNYFRSRCGGVRDIDLVPLLRKQFERANMYHRADV